jgi:hypothetical protein
MLGKFLIQAAINNMAGGTPTPTPAPTPTILPWILQISASVGTLSVNDENLYFYGQGGDLMRFTTNGGLLWQRKTSAGSRILDQLSVKALSDGVYVLSMDRELDTYISANVNLVKYSNSGSLLWSKSLTILPEDINSVLPHSFSVNSSGDVYLIGDGRGDLFVAKYSRTGDLEWQKSYDFSNQVICNSTVGADNNLYVIAYCYGAGISIFHTIFYKINPSGQILDSFKIDGFEGQGIFVDDENKVYLSGLLYSNVEELIYAPIFLKINPTSPTSIEWQKVITSEDTLSLDRITKLSHIGMSDDRILFYGTRTHNIYQAVGLPIFAFDKDGSYVRTGQIGHSAGYEQSTGLDTNSEDYVYFGMKSQEDTPGVGQINSFIVKLPNDGTKTGIYPVEYGNIFYDSEKSSTTDDGSLSLEQVTPTTSDGALVEVTSNIVDTTSTLQYTKTTI